MPWLTALNARLSRWALYIASICLASLLVVVVYGVVMRYGFNDAPPYVEQVALLLVISVAMFGASTGVRESGHIGLDSLVRTLPPKVQFWCKVAVEVLSGAFAVSLILGGIEMALSTRGTTIPTLGLPEALRYLPVIIAGVLIVLFCIELLIALFQGRKVEASWH
ncbi:TRAP transporter small permease [Ramlibacter sp. G-1-2-2]|uniref:TRAP transporter small permease protein n=1 Tax=Ramlibacter agri TaxID=2728837 RepID=A0A848GY37_9BURK|nr:TRAP transporter small permease [Ramlibacter agri]